MNEKLKDFSFSINIESSTLDDVFNRLKNSRLTKDFGNKEWKYGTEENYLRDLIDYWLNKYDWKKHEKEINKFSHYKIKIDNIPIHFIYEKGSSENSKPLILTHGWPWTFWDYKKIIEPLTHPEKYGGNLSDSFDVIIPSLPGYGFSTPLKKTGINFWKTSDIWVKLMTDILGYKKFFAHGGDWGAAVTLQLGHKYSSIVPAIHTHMAVPIDFVTNPHPDISFYSESEKKWHEKNMNFVAEGNGYFQIQASRPQTLAYGLNDSPAGLLAWLMEKRRAWSDCNGDIESRFSKDDLINTAMIYWLSESFGTSARYYYEAIHNIWKPSHDRHPMVESITGFTIFEGDVIFRPRKWMEKEHNLQYWNVKSSGGHFAPMEEPDVLIDEIRKFFNPYRNLI